MKKNFIYNSLYQILILILPMITAPYVTRVLGPANLGDYTYTQSIAGYFVLFAMLGINNYGNRTISRVRDNKEVLQQTFSELVTMQFAVTGIISIIYVIFSVYNEGYYRIYYSIMTLYVLSAGLDINWFCFGLEKFKLSIIRNTVVRTATVLAVFIFIKEPGDTASYIFINSLGIFLGQVCVWPYVLRIVKWKRPEIKKVLLNLKPNLIMFIPVLAVSLYRVMDIIMLGWLCTSEEVAYYSYADRLIQIPLSIVTALTSVLMPRVTNMIAHGYKKESMRIFDSAIHITACMCSAFAFGMISVADTLVPLYYGEEFRACALYLKLLSPVIVVNGIASVIRTQYLIPLGRDKVYIYSVFAGAGMNLILNLCLIRQIGSVGAVYATIFAEMAVFIVQIAYLHKELSLLTYIKDIVVFGSIGLGMLFLLNNIEISSPFWQLVVQFISGAFFYCTAVVCYLKRFHKNSILYVSLLHLFRRGRDQ